jgi:hypothetical protein
MLWRGDAGIAAFRRNDDPCSAIAMHGSTRAMRWPFAIGDASLARMSLRMP